MSEININMDLAVTMLTCISDFFAFKTIHFQFTEHVRQNHKLWEWLHYRRTRYKDFVQRQHYLLCSWSKNRQKYKIQVEYQSRRIKRFSMFSKKNSNSNKNSDLNPFGTRFSNDRKFKLSKTKPQWKRRTWGQMEL